MSRKLRFMAAGLAAIAAAGGATSAYAAGRFVDASSLGPCVTTMLTGSGHLTMVCVAPTVSTNAAPTPTAGVIVIDVTWDGTAAVCPTNATTTASYIDAYGTVSATSSSPTNWTQIASEAGVVPQCSYFSSPTTTWNVTAKSTVLGIGTYNTMTGVDFIRAEAPGLSAIPEPQDVFSFATVVFHD